MQIFTSSIGKKIVMAVSGLSMVSFACIHLLGNLTIFGGLDGGINAYAHHLHSMPWPIIVAFRAGLLSLFMLHVCFGISLAMDNSSARQAYAVKATRKTTFASETMIWTGLLLLAFIVFHLLHFTFQTVCPATAAKANLIAGMPDVKGMLYAAYKGSVVTLVYVAAMVVLFLHVSHGFQSVFQTLGLNNSKTMPVMLKAGTFVALVFLLGFASIPLTIFSNILK